MHRGLVHLQISAIHLPIHSLPWAFEMEFRTDQQKMQKQQGACWFSHCPRFQMELSTVLEPGCVLLAMHIPISKCIYTSFLSNLYLIQSTKVTNRHKKNPANYSAGFVKRNLITILL